MEWLMVRVKQLVLASAVVLGLYSCYRFIRSYDTAAKKLLCGPVFKSAGPPVRVYLRRISRLARGKKGFLLEAQGPVKAVFPDNNNPSRSLEKSGGTLRFKGGSAVWKLKGKTGQAFESPHRVRLEPAEGSPPLLVNNEPYPGILELQPAERIVVNELDVERYILGVVAGEMPARFHMEALRAQAIASRTYVLYQMLFRDGRTGWVVKDTVASQVYRGNSEVSPRIRRAVAETCGLIMVYENKVFEAYFHSTCGGNTRKASGAPEFFRAPDIPPLSGTECTFCKISRYYRWRCDYNENRVRNALNSRIDRELGPIVEVEPVYEREDQGIYPVYIRVHYKEGANRRSVEVLSPVIRATLNSLRSDSCKSPAITSGGVRGGVLHIKGRGYGHGVGMCQYGAEGQARAGRNYLQILQYYYPEVKLTSAWPKTPKEEVRASLH